MLTKKRKNLTLKTTTATTEKSLILKRLFISGVPANNILKEHTNTHTQLFQFNMLFFAVKRFCGECTREPVHHQLHVRIYWLCVNLKIKTLIAGVVGGAKWMHLLPLCFAFDSILLGVLDKLRAE